ncbi:MAG TPA: hypothetical protein VN915_15745 [Elusimicrobiota bacterium]|nr:hypothetical protein [Elusimicrobiota bacterium]
MSGSRLAPFPAWVTAFAVATVVAPFLLFAGNLLGLPLGRATAGGSLLLAVLVAHARFGGAAGPAPERGARRPWSWTRGLCLLLLAFAAATALLQALSLPLYHWDALVLYGFKAKVLFSAGTFRTPAFLDKGIVSPNANYPLLIPYLEAGFYALLGRVDERLVRLIFFAYWLAYLALVHAELRRPLGEDAALAAAALLGTAPLFFRDDATQAVSGSVDVAFAFYWTGAVLAALRAREDGDRRGLELCLVLVLGGLFTKPHGLALGLIPVGLALSRRSLRAHGPSIAVFAAAAAAWVWTRHLLPDNVDYVPRTVGASMLTAAWSRVPVVAGAWPRELFRRDHWGLFWVLALAVIAAGAARRRLTSPIRRILLALGAQLLVYTAVYLAAPNEIGGFLDSTLSRMTIHLSGLAAVAAGWTFELL